VMEKLETTREKLKGVIEKPEREKEKVKEITHCDHQWHKT